MVAAVFPKTLFTFTAQCNFSWYLLLVEYKRRETTHTLFTTEAAIDTNYNVFCNGGFTIVLLSFSF